MQEVCLLSVDRALADRLAHSLGDGVPVRMMQAVGEPNAVASIIVMDETAAAPDRSLGTAVTAVVEAARGRPVVLATDKADADTVLQAIRAGAADVIDRHGEGSDIGSVLIRLLNAQVASHNRAGHLTLVLGADPESAAIFATDLAMMRARSGPRSGQGHLLVDCTMPTSAAEAYLDTPVDYGIASAVADLHRLDSILLGNALARHGASGLMLLTLDGGTGVEPTGLGAFDIAALLKFLRATCDEVTFCVGSLRNTGLIRSIMASADGIEFVCAQSIRELKAARQLIEQLGLEEPVLERTRLVVWGHDDRIALDGRRIMEALGLGSFVNMPVDPVDLRNAVNSGRPLALKTRDTPYIRALGRVGGQTSAPRSALAAMVERVRGSVSHLMEWRS